jgi:hypothetical protein
MSASRVQLDFVGPRRPSRAAFAIALCGALAVIAAVAEYSALRSQADGLELKLAAVTTVRAAPSAKTPATERGAISEARAAASHLATPWGDLLDDLENAAKDSESSVALLSVEPDRDSHRITVVAEARSLLEAIKYVQRLQQSKVVGRPLLDSHEVRTDVPEHPVRVQITAEWKLVS